MLSQACSDYILMLFSNKGTQKSTVIWLFVMTLLYLAIRKFSSVNSAKTSKNLLTAKLFPAADILAATRDFSEECLIGEGFIGRVYRAGKSFAVRRFLDVLAQLFLPETLSGLILLLEEVSLSIIGELQEHRPRNLA